MSDLISRQAALDALNGCTEFYLNNLPPTISKANAVEAVTALPSADIDLSGFSDKLWAAAYERGKAEVVRCKDCKYFDSGTDEDGKLFFKCLGWVYGGTSEDDFCSHGERKDG